MPRSDLLRPVGRHLAGVAPAQNVDKMAALSAPGLLQLVLLAELVQFATSMFLPSLPALAVAFGVDARLFQRSVALYIVAFAVGQLAAGSLADRIGRRPVALTGAAAFGLSSLACAFTQDFGALLVLRVIEGVGASAAMVGGRAATRDTFSGRDLARVLALVSMGVWAIGGLASIIAGILQDRFGWRANLIVTGAFGLAVFMVLVVRWPETLRQAGTPVRGGYGPVLRSRSFWRYALPMACMIGALYAFLIGAPPIVIGRLGFSASAMGGFQLGAAAAFIAGALTASRLALRWGEGRLLAYGALIACGGAALLLAGGLSGVLTVLTVALPMAILAFGAGVVTPAAMAGSVQDFPDDAGIANAATGLVQTIGAGVGSGFASLPGEPAVIVPIVMTMLAFGTVASFALLSPRDPARQRLCLRAGKD